MFLLSLLLFLNFLVVSSCYCCWGPCWMLLSSLLSIWAVLLLHDAIHDDAIALHAAANSYFNSIPAFSGIHTVLVVLLSILFLLLWAVMILVSSFLLPDAGAAVVCIQTVAGILAVASVLLVPDGLLLLVCLLLIAFLVLLVFLLFLSNLLLLAVLLLLAFCCWWRVCIGKQSCWSWRPCFCWWLYILDCTMRHITRLSNYRNMTIGLLFFRLSDYRNIEYRIRKFKKLSDYRISDLGLNLSDYRISDSEKTIGCPPLL